MPVDEAGALAEEVPRRRPCRRVLQDRLDGVGRQRRVGLQHPRDDAAHHGRRHAGAAQRQIGETPAGGSRHQVGGAAGGQGAARVVERHDPRAGRHHVGLCGEVKRRGAARAVAGHAVVARIGRAHVAVGAHREHPGRVGRRGHAAVLRLAVVVAPEVTCRGDDHDARLDGAARRQGERIGLVRLEHGRADRQVDHPHAEPAAAGNDEVDGPDDVADVAAPVAIEHLQHQQVRPRRRPRVLAAAVVSGSGDDACHVRAVAIGVGHLAGGAGEVHETDDALPGQRLSAIHARQVGVPRREPRIDHCHAHAPSREGQRGGRRRRGAPPRAAVAARRQQRADGPVQMHPGHAGVVGQRLECVVGHLGDVAVHQREALPGDPSMPSDPLGEVAAGRAHDHARHAGLGHARPERLVEPVRPASRKRGPRQQRQQNQRDDHADGATGQCTHTASSAVRRD